MARRTLTNARIVLTGASSGIGWALALELARLKSRLLLTARREDRLQELAEEVRQAGGEAEIVCGDITDPELRQRLLAEAEAKFGAIDLLVNNAGVGAIGPFAEADEARLRKVMEVNFFAPTELTRAALPLLRKGKTPMIANVGSVLSHRGVPNNTEYCASKFALHGWSDALRAELAGEIDVLLICPSTTKTEFFDSVLEDKGDLPWLKFGAQTPETVARSAVSAIQWGSHETVLSIGGKMLVFFDRMFPTITNHLVARYG